MRYTWHHLHTLGQQPLVFITSHPLYSLHHMRYIWYLIYSVWCHIHYVLHHTMTLSMTSNIICFWHTHLIWHHTVLWPHNQCVPSQPLCLTLHSVNFWYYTQCTNFMTRSECKSSLPLYVRHHMHYIWHHIHSLLHHISLCMTSSPLCITSHPIYLTSCPLYLCNNNHTLNDITASLCMISRTLYMWHPIHYIYNIISTMYDNTILCVVDTTLGLCVTTFDYRWYHIHSITMNHSIYDVISTSGMT